MLSDRLACSAWSARLARSPARSSSRGRGHAGPARDGDSPQGRVSFRLGEPSMDGVPSGGGMPSTRRRAATPPRLPFDRVRFELLRHAPREAVPCSCVASTRLAVDLTRRRSARLHRPVRWPPGRRVRDRRTRPAYRRFRGGARAAPYHRTRRGAGCLDAPVFPDEVPRGADSNTKGLRSVNLVDETPRCSPRGERKPS